MNARLNLRAIGKSHHGSAGALLACQWMRERDYFTLQTKAPGAWLETGWRRRPGRTARALLAPGWNALTGMATFPETDPMAR